MRAQVHTKFFEELTTWERVPYWGLFLTSTGSSRLLWTLWISEMNPSKAPVLKPYVLKKFCCEFGELFRSLLRESDLYLWNVHARILLKKIPSLYAKRMFSSTPNIWQKRCYTVTVHCISMCFKIAKAIICGNFFTLQKRAAESCAVDTCVIEYF